MANAFRVGVWLLIGAVVAAVVIERLDGSASSSATPESSIQTTFEAGHPVDPATDPAAAYAPEPGDEVPTEHALEPDVGRSQRARDRAAEELGYYPPAPSRARGMTPEWREFADDVDRICGATYRWAIAREARVEQLAQLRNWGRARTDAAVTRVWADQGAQIVGSTERLGPPPMKARLFARWRANVMARSRLRERAADAARRGEFRRAAEICEPLYRMKRASDRIGQRFGLRICTSN